MIRGVITSSGPVARSMVLGTKMQVVDCLGPHVQCIVVYSRGVLPRPFSLKDYQSQLMAGRTPIFFEARIVFYDQNWVSRTVFSKTSV